MQTYPTWSRVSNERDYQIVFFPAHPKARANGYVPVHRVIMEKIMGRYLTTGEIVHHKNGDKADNRLWNLELMTRAEHGRHHSTPGRTMVTLSCPGCGIEFTRERRNTHLVKPQKQTFCSRKCMGRYYSCDQSVTKESASML